MATPTPTPTELLLARTWAKTPDNTSCWFDRFEEFAMVAKVLDAESCAVGAELYREASMMALARAVYSMRMPRSSDIQVAA